MIDYAPYMRWSKVHEPPRFDLAGSNLLAATLADLPEARDALRIAGLNPYGYPPLLEAIAERYGTTADHVAPASGAGGANFLALAALIGHGDEVLIERPAYDPLLGALRFLGARIRRWDRRFEDGWRADADAIREALTPATRLVVLTNPHNPTGVLDDEAALRAIGEEAAKVGARVLVDEAYLDVAVDSPHPAATLDDVFVSTSSLTKSHGLSGIRAGWVLAAPELAERIRRVRDVMDGIGPISSDVIAEVAFRHIHRLEARAKRIVAGNRAILMDVLEARPEIEFVPPAGTVVFPRLRGIADAGPFLDRLREEHGTQLGPGAFFETPAHFRIPFGGEPAVLRGGLAGLVSALDAGV